MERGIPIACLQVLLILLALCAREVNAQQQPHPQAGTEVVVSWTEVPPRILDKLTSDDGSSLRWTADDPELLLPLRRLLVPVRAQAGDKGGACPSTSPAESSQASIDELLDLAAEALMFEELDQAKRYLSEARKALPCSPSISRDTLAHYFLLQGMGVVETRDARPGEGSVALADGQHTLPGDGWDASADGQHTLPGDGWDASADGQHTLPDDGSDASTDGQHTLPDDGSDASVDSQGSPEAEGRDSIAVKRQRTAEALFARALLEFPNLPAPEGYSQRVQKAFENASRHLDRLPRVELSLPAAADLAEMTLRLDGQNYRGDRSFAETGHLGLPPGEHLVQLLDPDGGVVAGALLQFLSASDGPIWFPPSFLPPSATEVQGQLHQAILGHNLSTSLLAALTKVLWTRGFSSFRFLARREDTKQVAEMRVLKEGRPTYSTIKLPSEAPKAWAVVTGSFLTGALLSGGASAYAYEKYYRNPESTLTQDEWEGARQIGNDTAMVSYACLAGALVSGTVAIFRSRERPEADRQQEKGENTRSSSRKEARGSSKKPERASRKWSVDLSVMASPDRSGLMARITW